MLCFRFEMNILKKYSIAHKGLGVGKHNYEFEVNNKFFSAFEGSEIKAGHAIVLVEVDKSVGGLSLEVSIKGEVTVECDRCLEDCRLGVDFEDTLLVRYSETISEYDGEVMWISQGETEVNLAQYIYESISLSLPYQKVHPLDADGEPTCDEDMLQRFRIVSEQEFEQIAEPHDLKIENNPQWDKLKEFKEQLNK